MRLRPFALTFGNEAWRNYAWLLLKAIDCRRYLSSYSSGALPEVRRTFPVVCGGLGTQVFSFNNSFWVEAPTTYHSKHGWLSTQLLEREIPVRAR